jgi:hypothetical protein
MWCDFHLHSDHSDGEFPPTKVVDIVADAGIGVMALTDHDTTAGHDEARARATARGLTFVGGIEMTAYAAPEVVHVLGLGVSTHDAGLARANAIAMAPTLPFAFPCSSSGYVRAASTTAIRAAVTRASKNSSLRCRPSRTHACLRRRALQLSSARRAVWRS